MQDLWPGQVFLECLHGRFQARSSLFKPLVLGVELPPCRVQPGRVVPWRVTWAWVHKATLPGFRSITPGLRPCGWTGAVPGIRYPSMINGLPVVTAPAEIDATIADKLQTVLLEAVENGHATIVVDLTGTRFCDSFGLRVLGAAHRRALKERGELRLVLPAAGGPLSMSWP